MTALQKQMLGAFAETSDRPVFTLREFSGEEGDIEDPAMQGEEVFKTCRDEIKRCLEKSMDACWPSYPDETADAVTRVTVSRPPVPEYGHRLLGPGVRRPARVGRSRDLLLLTREPGGARRAAAREGLGVASRIEAFITEIERQIGFTIQPHFGAPEAALAQRRIDYLRLQRQSLPITEVATSTARGSSSNACLAWRVEGVGSQATSRATPSCRGQGAGRLLRSGHLPEGLRAVHDDRESPAAARAPGSPWPTSI